MLSPPTPALPPPNAVREPLPRSLEGRAALKEPGSHGAGGTRPDGLGVGGWLQKASRMDTE